MPQNHLIEYLKRGDHEAFEIIFCKHYFKVRNFIQSVLYHKSMTEDITQQLFLIIWERRANINLSKNFPAYLFTIARNLVYRENRRAILENQLISEYTLDFNEADNSLTESLDAEEMENLLMDSIDQMPVKQQKVFRLSKIHVKSNHEIAKELKMSERAVEGHLYRAMRKLKQLTMGNDQ